jgi:hypothetical protein
MFSLAHQQKTPLSDKQVPPNQVPDKEGNNYQI